VQEQQVHELPQQQQHTQQQQQHTQQQQQQQQQPATTTPIWDDSSQAVTTDSQLRGWAKEPLAPQDGSARAGVQWLQQLSQELTMSCLFSELLPAGLHCPIMGVEETDAVQVGAHVCEADYQQCWHFYTATLAAGHAMQCR
jgi:hypothetical protein